MTNQNFKVFPILSYIPERILSVIPRHINGSEFIEVGRKGVFVDVEFWIGRFNNKSNKGGE